MPLSDSVHYQDTTEGTGDQEINVIGVSNHLSYKLSTKAPTLFKIIHNSVVTKGLVRNKHKRDVQYPGLCTAVGILLKERNREMCGVHLYISSALISTKIHKVCVCVCVCVCVYVYMCVCEWSTQITVLIFFYRPGHS